MGIIDGFGAPVSHTNREAVDQFHKAAVLMLGYAPDPNSIIREVLQSDPDFIMARCFLAGTFLTSSDKRNQIFLRNEYYVLRNQVGNANDRERGHIEAIRLWLSGDFYAASQAYADILLHCPRDLCALQFGHQVDFLLGQTSSTRDRPSRVLKHWTTEDPELSFILGMHAFGLEECGHYSQAQAMAERCVELNPRDTWGVHALAHCHEMQGQLEEGIAFMQGCEDKWAGDNYLAMHNRWHLLLYWMEKCEFGHVLNTHDDTMQVGESPELMNLHDSAALLWRLKMSGVDTGTRWDALADEYEKVLDQAYMPFTDMHAIIAFVAAKRDSASESLIRAMQKNQNVDSVSSFTIRGAGLALVKGFYAFGQGDYDRAKRLLANARHSSHLLGGSIAQRDVINVTLMEAAVRSKDVGMVEGLIAERSIVKGETPLTQLFRDRVTSG